MNVRALSTSESANLRVIAENVRDYSLLFLTAVGLRKSILDATQPMRTLFLESRFHDYAAQGLGRQECGVERTALLIEDQRVTTTTLSIYRPKTKHGDPRMWPYGLTRFGAPADVVAVFIHAEQACFVNLTRSRLAADSEAGIVSEAIALLQSVRHKDFSVADELLARLRVIARSPLRSVIAGEEALSRSRAIGHSIESALGLAWNPRKTPDYKGIELKSGRGSSNRSTLFSCVPDWNLSVVKSCAEILDRYGYWDDDGRWALYCDVQTSRTNTQGLRLRLDKYEDYLFEFSAREPKGDFATWPLTTLHASLLEKHPETFWIKARSEVVDGHEFFHLKSVVHTRQPSMTQFDLLLDQGHVVINHRMHYRGPGKTGIRDHGLPFRIRPSMVTQLFSLPSKSYNLIEN